MERLLLVEHNLLFRDGLALLLKWETGLSSVYARSLAEVQDVLDVANEKPICVILDLDLLDGDSAELLKQLNGLPVVAHIRSHSLEREAKALDAGADEVVRTEAIEKLVAAVERLIDHRPHSHRIAPVLYRGHRGGTRPGPSAVSDGVRTASTR
jgi:DNA-binding response OmpR family regulator